MDDVRMRLLPWTGPEGKSCFLSTDASGGGYVSRLADDMEAVQLDIGAQLVGHAQALLDDPKAHPGELRFLSARLTEALCGALRVAESRGGRLPGGRDEGTHSSAT
ncbi:hypothetical protein [Streptomyces sp. NPDC048438]|uniref:hypothetical protein n=1 Tax=Streptomyces sp. NPDC048438 TaxID=3365551 RepID=UPI003710FC35